MGSAPTFPKSGLPFIYPGTSTPNIVSTVGAMSFKCGFCFSILRFENITPGTIFGSTQWSPLQCFVLSSKTSSVTFPTAHVHELLYPALYPINKSGASCL